MSDYEGVLAWLYGLELAKGMDFKLERVELALESLGDPHRSYPSIHVAGTNGKGSVAAMCQAMLSAAGYRAGLYVSPHLVRFTERIRVGSEEISPDEVVDLAQQIRATATSRGIDLTFFEFVTVLAFSYFARRRVDVAVVEVGLGGRLDATNVIEPEVAVVTTIGLDHQQYLGDTVEEIAAEKGGILKAGRPAVFGRLRAAADSTLRRIAAERRCPVVALGADFGLRPEAEAFSYRGPAWHVDGLRLPLLGAHQVDNAAVAVAALEAASVRLPLPAEAVREGLARTSWPGRLEVVRVSPTIILDGAHNGDGVEALVAAVEPLVGRRRLRLLFGVMGDKDWTPMVERLAEIAADVTVTTVLPPRGEDAERLSRVFARSRPVQAVADPLEAFDRLVADSAPEDVVLVAGSLFLVGAVYPAVDRLRRGTLPAGGAEAG